MNCAICELKQRQFYCENCLKTHIHDLRQQTAHYAVDRDEHVSKATRALEETMRPGRLTRAALSATQRQVEELQAGLAKMRKENERKRDRLQSLRETLASRRRTMSAAKLQLQLPSVSATPTPPPPTPELSALSTALGSLSATIARARSGLVQELVEVFNVVEVGGRPPIGGKAGTKGEWTIGDLILPVPGDIRRYPPDHINAVLTHTVHFLSLLTFYLGVRLPFEVVWSEGKLGVGQPWIGAIRGGETGGWARWYTKHPLHLSSAPPSPTSPPPSSTTTTSRRTISQSHGKSTSSSTSSRRMSASNLSSSTALAASVVSADPPAAAPQASFTTALSMLLYNVSYLAHTQNVDVPLSQAGDVLCNLWGVCCSAELGRKSHETYPPLPPPTPASFPLDFAQLLQATTANPASRPRARRVGGPAAGATGGGGGLARERIEEREDEDWDLVDDDV